MEIGSKTAEKNSAQTNKQTDKPTDTTKIMVTWPWTNRHFVYVLQSACSIKMMHGVPFSRIANVQ